MLNEVSSLYAVATGSDKKVCYKLFGRISFADNPKSISKACEERLVELTEWKNNLEKLKEEANQLLVEHRVKVLRGLSIQQLKDELARRGQTV